jgi:branched-chain amino acid transport system permease protein
MLGGLIVSGLLLGAVYALMALGLSVIFGVLRIVNFAHGDFMLLAMYTTFVLCSYGAIDPLIIAPAVIVGFFALGYGLQRGFLNRFIGRTEHNQFLMLLALGLIVSSGLSIIFGPDARNVQVSYSFDSISVFGILIDEVRLVAAAGAVLVMLLLTAFFRLTSTGKMVRACADNYVGAIVIGLNVRHIYAMTFGIGTACVGAAGAFMLLLVDVQPYIATNYTLLSFIVVILGGLGSLPGALVAGLIVGLSEALAAFYLDPSLKGMFTFGLLILILLVRPQGLFGRLEVKAGPKDLGVQGPKRYVGVQPIADQSWLMIGAALLFIALLGIPPFLSRYLVSVLITLLFAAFFAQAWNIMMGYAGQLSLGHALYLGLGAYIAGALFAHIGLTVWVGMALGMVVSALLACILVALTSRFRVTGVYFALITLAVAEFVRVGFNHLDWVGATGGLFLSKGVALQGDILNLRAGPLVFYYIVFLATALSLGLTWMLLRTRVGYYWKAIREDRETAESLGVPVLRYELLAAAISAAMTSAGGTLLAFYMNQLYPNSFFSVDQSIGMMVVAIVGGVGTLLGPLVAATALSILSEGTTALASVVNVNGTKQLMYGLVLLIVLIWLPQGIWPWLQSLSRPKFLKLVKAEA